jgi:hypothetical protein
LLTQQEVRDIINFLSAKTANAVVFISALQRISLALDKPNVYSLHLHKVRALSDIILVFESSLRNWQPADLGELGSRTSELLRPNTIAFRYYNQINASYPHYDWKNPVNINQFTTNEIQRYDAALHAAEKAATAIYTIYRLRNSLMHVLEDQLDVFLNPNKLSRLISFAIIAIRVSKFGSENQLVLL